MLWAVLEHPAFAEERPRLPDAVRDKLAEVVSALEQIGPQLGRPLVDTLNGSRHRHMKEIRLSQDGGVWRFAFAFDPERQAVLLVGGTKHGVAQKRFYRRFIAVADERFDEWLEAEE